MKFSNFLLMVILLSFCAKNVHGQDCQVLVPAIAGKYTGGCRQGKAEGSGKAEGTDQYTGQFRAGLPNGAGVYTWKNGDIFKGIWVMGIKEGQGTLTIKREGKADSVVTGVWKKDVYAGVYVKPEKPYTIYQKSNYFSRCDFRKNTNSKENSIEFIITSVTAGTSRLSPLTIAAPATISDINITKGSNGMVIEGFSSARGTSKKLQDVVFPFRATVTVGGQELDFEIADPGAWTITLAINQ